MDIFRNVVLLCGSGGGASIAERYTHEAGELRTAKKGNDQSIHPQLERSLDDPIGTEDQ